MALPSPATSWIRDLELPSQLFGTATNNYELYEADDEFVLTVEMPGFDAEDIAVSWDDGRLNVAAEHSDPDRGQTKTYHRRFRFPKEVDPEDIEAQYRNGVLEVTLPAVGAARGTEIPVEG